MTALILEPIVIQKYYWDRVKILRNQKTLFGAFGILAAFLRTYTDRNNSFIILFKGRTTKEPEVSSLVYFRIN